MSLFCYRCGQRLPDDARFCSKCGTAVLQEAEEIRTPEPISVARTIAEVADEGTKADYVTPV
jgi:predicted amidophosphoribosyltransferase